MNISEIQKWAENARTLLSHIDINDGKPFVEYSRMVEDVLEFIGSSATTVSKELYSLISPALVTRLPQLDFRVNISYVGTSSFGLRTTMLHRSTDTVLAQNDVQVTLVYYSFEIANWIKIT